MARTNSAQPVHLWRIAAETRQFRADDLSGAGAAALPGRWNEEAQRVVYASTTIALAALETAAHIDAGRAPRNRFVVRIDVPRDLWTKRLRVDPGAVSPAWAALPAGDTSLRMGSTWLFDRRSLLLQVPSVIVPEEANVLINPLHPDAGRLAAAVHRAFDFSRLWRGPALAFPAA